ncbi:MAG: septum formation inhibitor Maf [Chromatiales bacterium]|nr:septum formation inhibitor Maf [Chromatiales bacterium]
MSRLRGSSRLVWLASRSPRRRELLAQLGLEPRVLDVEVDESPRPGETVEALVLRLARLKAESAGAALPDGPPAAVVAADTLVTLDGAVFGKPADQADAARMLAALSGRTHEVLSGVAVQSEGRVRTAISRSRVTMREVTPAEAERYWRTGEPADKAGGYAVQGIAALFISRLEGSFSGVMGLPLYETAALLAECGYQLPVLPDGSDDAR